MTFASKLNPSILGRFLVIGFISISLLACGESFEAGSQLTANSSLSGGGGITPIAPADPLEGIDLQAKVSGGIFDGKKVLDIDKQNMDLLITLPVDLSFGLGLGSIPIPDIKGAEVGIITDANGKDRLQVRVPLDKIIRGVPNLVEQPLPNGNPLPKVPGGTLPHKEIKIGGNKAHLYMGDGIVGFFLPSDLSSPVDWSFKIKNGKKDTLGYFSLVKKDNGMKGGFFLHFVLPQKVIDILDPILPVGT